jgi:hypothetical protein
MVPAHASGRWDAPNKRDAEDAEPRLTAWPRGTRHNWMIGGATPDFSPSDASLVRGTAPGRYSPQRPFPSTSKPRAGPEPADAR